MPVAYFSYVYRSVNLEQLCQVSDSMCLLASILVKVSDFLLSWFLESKRNSRQRSPRREGVQTHYPLMRHYCPIHIRFEPHRFISDSHLWSTMESSSHLHMYSSVQVETITLPHKKRRSVSEALAMKRMQRKKRFTGRLDLLGGDVVTYNNR